MTILFMATQVLSGLMLITFILLHAGRGGGLSDMFGGGIGGPSGASLVEKNLNRITVAVALTFVLSTVFLHFQIRQ